MKKATSFQEWIWELEKELVKMEWEIYGLGHGWTKETAERYRELYEKLQELCPKYRGKRFWEGFYC